jgi:hypothetical protein
MWILLLLLLSLLLLFENRVLRRIFELEKEEVLGAWRRLRNEEFHYL